MAYSVHLAAEYKEENDDVCKTLASFKTELAAIDLNFQSNFVILLWFTQQ